MSKIRRSITKAVIAELEKAPERLHMPQEVADALDEPLDHVRHALVYLAATGQVDQSPVAGVWRGARVLYRAKSSDQVATRVHGLRTPQTMRRACLCCGDEFASEGAHNRLCDRCRRVGSSVSPYAL